MSNLQSQIKTELVSRSCIVVKFQAHNLQVYGSANVRVMVNALVFKINISQNESIHLILLRHSLGVSKMMLSEEL